MVRQHLGPAQGWEGSPPVAAEAPRPLPPAQSRQRRESGYLVGAPVVQGDDGEAKGDPRPGDVSADGVSEDVEGVGAWREALRRGSPVPFPGEGRLGLWVPALQLLVPAYLVKGLKTPHSRSVPAAAQEPRRQCETRQGGRQLTLCVLTGRPSPPTPAQSGHWGLCARPPVLLLLGADPSLQLHSTPHGSGGPRLTVHWAF